MAAGEYREQKYMEYTEKSEEILQNLPRFCTQYARGIENKRNPLTIYTYLQRIQVFFEYLAKNHEEFQGRTVKQITYDDLAALKLVDIEDFTHWLRNGGASAERISQRKRKHSAESSINNYLSALSSLWTYAMRHGYLEHNLIKDIERGSKTKHTVIAITKEQEEDLFDSIETGDGLTAQQQNHRNDITAARDYAICMLFLRTGLRVSELVGLNIDDINFDRNFVNVIRKENKPDNVFFSDNAAEALKMYLDMRPMLYPDPTEKAVFLVTIGKYKGQRISVRSVQQMVKKYGKIAIPELGNTMHPHGFRSSYASRSVRINDLGLVQQQLNHESPATTALYINDRAEQLEKHRNDLD